MAKKICLFCKKDFFGKPIRKYCSKECAAKSRIPGVILRNKARRKYEAIEGFSKVQIHRYFNPDWDLKIKNRELIQRKIVIDFLGGKCITCGYDRDSRALQLDHILGDGHNDRKEKGSKLCRYYSKNLEEAKIKLQILCANCNRIKQAENEEFMYSKRGNSVKHKISETLKSFRK